MGNCMAPDSKRKYTNNSINREYTLTVGAQPLDKKNSQEQKLPIITTDRIQSKEHSRHNKVHFEEPNKPSMQVEIDPLQDINKKEEKPNIRPTISIFVPQQVPITYDQNNRGSLVSPVRQSDVDALFPNGVEQLQSGRHDKNRISKQYDLESPVNPIGKNRNTFERAITTNNFMNSNANNNVQGLPERLPSNSIKRKPNQTVNGLHSPKPLSIIQSQNQMLQSQTVTLITEKKIDDEGSNRGYENGTNEKETRRRPTIEDPLQESYKQYRRGTF